MPFKQAFGAAALPVAGVSAAAIAAAIGYFLYTGLPRDQITASAPMAVSSPEPALANEAPREDRPQNPIQKPKAPASVAPAAKTEDVTSLAEPTIGETAQAPQSPLAQSDLETSSEASNPVETPLETNVRPETQDINAQEHGTPARAEQNENTVAMALSAPSIDVVRIPPTGLSTIAGRADSDTEIVIFVDGVEVARTTTGANGDFVSLFEIPAVDRPREMQIAAQKGAKRVFASSSIVIAPYLAAPVRAPLAAVASAGADSDADLDTATLDTAEPVGSEPDMVDTRDIAQAMIETDTAQAVTGTEADKDPSAASFAEANLTSQDKTIPQDKTETSSRPAPTVMVADDSGVKILQSAAPVEGVSIDAITYGSDGAVFASGRGQPGARVQLYLSNAALTDTLIGSDGQWRTALDVDAGIYSLRADMVDADLKVLSRVEIPFKREDVNVLARLSQRAVAERSETAEPALANAGAEQNDAQMAEAQMTAAPEGAGESTLTDTTSPNAASVTPQSRIASVTVQPGNTLWGIASDTYGDGFLYARVFNANVAQIRDADLIYPGQVFVLPKE